MDAKITRTPLAVAVSFLEHYCLRNGVNFYQRPPEAPTTANVVIVGTDRGDYGSIGVDQTDGSVKCYYRDNRQYKWAQLEGFTEEEIYEHFEDSLVKEVTLEQMASLFVGGKS